MSTEIILRCTLCIENLEKHIPLEFISPGSFSLPGGVFLLAWGLTARGGGFVTPCWAGADDIKFCYNLLHLLVIHLNVQTSIFNTRMSFHMSLVIRKPAFCICENKDADQLRGNREADQRLCFCYIDSTIPLLPKFQASSHLVWLYSPVCV